MWLVKPLTRLWRSAPRERSSFCWDFALLGSLPYEWDIRRAASPRSFSENFRYPLGCYQKWGNRERCSASVGGIRHSSGPDTPPSNPWWCPVPNVSCCRQGPREGAGSKSRVAFQQFQKNTNLCVNVWYTLVQEPHEHRIMKNEDSKITLPSRHGSFRMRKKWSHSFRGSRADRKLRSADTSLARKHTFPQLILTRCHRSPKGFC